MGKPKQKTFKGEVRTAADHLYGGKALKHLLDGATPTQRKQGGTKPHKYHAQRTTLDGYNFDSKAEADRYAQLQILVKANLITRLQIHPSWDLDISGTRICRYEADFSYVREGVQIVEDVKGMSNGAAWRLFKLKAALMWALHGIKILVVTRGKGGAFKGEQMVFKEVE